MCELLLLFLYTLIICLYYLNMKSHLMIISIKRMLLKRKKNVSAILFIICSLVIWMLWSTSKEVNITIHLIKQKNYFTRNTLISPLNVCKEQFLVILVTSYAGHVELRSAHRRAMPPELLKSMNVTRIFSLAKIPQTDKYITQEAILDESNTFGDILQGSFVENYRNLTHKHLMGLQWASTNCKSSFILKVDDDTVFNLNSTINLLIQLRKLQKDNILMGYMLNNTIPRRNKQNKWYVTFKEYPRNEYPPYLSGWYYIVTPDLAQKLCDEAIYHPYFWIDDIFVTGILVEALNIKLKQLPDNFWLEYYELIECCITDMIKKAVTCDYVVGPNGGRNNLIVEYNDAVSNCIAKNCTRRPLDKSLKTTCIVNKERNIFSDGQAEVKYVKL